jgi:MFS family permease
MSLWSLGPLLGPVIGPIAGGFLSQAEGWRWIFWVIAIATGVSAIAALFILSESYAPILLERKAKRLRRENGNELLRSKLDKGLGPKELFSRAIVRPSKLLAMSPICQLLSLYIAILYGMMYLLFTTFTFVFEGTYGFSQSTVGLTFIGTGVGLLLGLAVYGFTADRIYIGLARRNNNEYKPEFRLPPLLVTTPFVPVGFFIYGWTAQYKVSTSHI